MMGPFAEGVRLIQSVMLGLSLARVPVREALRELGDALAQPEALADLPGVLDSWRRVVCGAVGPDTRAGYVVAGGRESASAASAPSGAWADMRPGERRCAMAMNMARTAPGGVIRSRELAEAAGVSPETARLDLAVLCERGALEAHGQKRARYYTVRRAGRDGTMGHNASGVGVAAE